MNKRIKRIAPLQLGKMLAVIYASASLVMLPVAALFFLVLASGKVTDSDPAIMLLPICLSMILCGPIIYGVMGFLTGWIGAHIYNIVAKWLGGIEIELAE